MICGVKEEIREPQTELRYHRWTPGKGRERKAKNEVRGAITFSDPGRTCGSTREPSPRI